MFKKSLLFLIFIVQSIYSQTWEEFGPFYGELKTGEYYHAMGLVNAIWLNPKNHNEFVMATNSSGIWKTSDSGKTWFSKTSNTPLIPGFGARSIVANPANNNELLAAAGNYAYSEDTYGAALLKSTDGGDSWFVDPNFKNPDWNSEMIKVYYHNAQTIYAATTVQLMKSSNGGKTWEVLFRIDEKNKNIDQPYQTLTDFTVFEDETILLSSAQKWGNTGQLWRRNIKGNCSQLVKNGVFKEIKGAQILCGKITDPIQNTCYVGLVVNKQIWLYKTVNKGETFELQDRIKLNYETGDAKAGKFELEMSQNNPKKVYFGLIEFFDWTKASGLIKRSPSPNISAYEHDDVRFMQVHLTQNKEEEFVLMGNDGGVSIYYPNDSSFKSLNGYYLPTLQVYNLGVSQFDNPNMVIGTQDNGTFEYSGVTKKWTWLSGGDGGASWVSQNGRKRFYCINASISYEGEKKRYYSPNQPYSGWFLDFPVMMNEAETKMYFGSSKRGNSRGARLYIQEVNQYKQDKGKEVNGVAKIGEIEIDPISPHVVYIAAGEAKEKKTKEPMLLKSVDYGKNFVDVTNAPVYSKTFDDTTSLFDILNYRVISSVEMDPVYSDVVFVTLTGYRAYNAYARPSDFFKVLKSEDGGKSWVDFSEGLRKEYPVHKIFRHPSAKELIFCGTDEGVYYRGYRDGNWQKFGEGFPENITVSDIELNLCEEMLYISTYGRGIWRIKLPEYKPVTIKLKDDKTISTPTYLKTNIEVKKKTTLTISSDVIMANNCSITLEPKSKLIIDGGSLIAKCSKNWDKINIEEKRFLWIFKRKKGKVIIKNGEMFVD